MGGGRGRSRKGREEEEGREGRREGGREGGREWSYLLLTPYSAGLLQIVMFALYGNQYENREEHHLLSMFEVRQTDRQTDRRMTMYPCSLHCSML